MRKQKKKQKTKNMYFCHEVISNKTLYEQRKKEYYAKPTPKGLNISPSRRIWQAPPTSFLDILCPPWSAVSSGEKNIKSIWQQKFLVIFGWWALTETIIILYWLIFVIFLLCPAFAVTLIQVNKLRCKFQCKSQYNSTVL